MRNIGYTSNNCSRNLGTLYFVIAFYFIQVLFTLFLAIFSKLTGKGVSILDKLISLLFFSEILILSIDGFMEFYITGYL